MKRYFITHNGKKHDLILDSDNSFVMNNQTMKFELMSSNGGITFLKIGDNIYNLFYKKINETDFEIWIKQYVFNISVTDSRSQLLAQFNKLSTQSTDKIYIKAPMPGLVTKIEVKEGEIIQKGTGIIILEAMKMENEIKSNAEAIVKSISISERQTVEKDQTLIILEPIDHK